MHISFKTSFYENKIDIIRVYYIEMTWYFIQLFPFFWKTIYIKITGKHFTCVCIQENINIIVSTSYLQSH